ncbi:class I SAM-dependent methyltransferase [Cupriavidus plantarum]|uniref:class I SAM-dependent methyltransferase n=1 Tax=Cupriavidus plantarum TaxID=942865 RepID=UPI00339D9FAD
MRFFSRKATPGSVVSAIRKSDGANVKDWVTLIQMLRDEGKFTPDVVSRIESHEIGAEGHAVNHFADEISKASATELRALASQLSPKRPEDVVTQALDIIIKKKSIFQCRDAHTEGGYYADAELGMDWQWDNLIAPFIRDADLSVALELAPGHGRNSAKLIQQGAKVLHLVDVNQTCIDACRDRFGAQTGDCQLQYHVTAGDSLPFIETESLTFVYSFDSMVHFDRSIILAYLREFARAMKPGATGYIHHSNYGAIAPNSDWAKNIGNRSDMSAALFREYCAEVGLEVTDQRLHGRAEQRGIDDLDCASLIRKP